MFKRDVLKQLLRILLIQLPFIAALIALSSMEPYFVEIWTRRHVEPERLLMISESCHRLVIAAFLTPLPMMLYLFYQRKYFEGLSGVRKIIEPSILMALYYAMIAMRFLQYPVGTDDPYMDYEFVRNWLDGTSFDFNPGQHVMGYTSTLHVIFLYIVGVVTQFKDMPVLSFVFNGALGCLVYLGLHALIIQQFRNGWQALVACACYAGSKYGVVEIAVGKETLMMDSFILISMFSLNAKRWGIFAWMASLLFLTRPEGIFWLGASLFKSFYECGIKVWKAWAVPLSVVAAIYLFLWVYYGSIIPHGAIGRATMFQSVWEPSDKATGFVTTQLAAESFGNLFTAGFSIIDAVNHKIAAVDQRYILDKLWLSLAVQGVFALLLFGWLGRNHEPIRFYFYGAVLVLSFFSITDPWTFPWYYGWFNLIPPILISMIALALMSIKPRKNRAFTQGLATVFVIYLIVQPVMWDDPFFIWNPEKSRLIVYKRAADYVNGTKQQVKTVAVVEPGVLAYYLPATYQVLDLGGLQSPEALKYYPVPACDYSRRYSWCSVPVSSIMELKPDCIITLDCFIDNGLTKNEKFMSEYVLARYWPVSTFDSRAVVLFVRTNLVRGVTSG